jgi:hypothetical protein
MAWAHAYQFAYTFAPNAFSYSEGRLNSFADWVYFSFTTLTTLGYGDIVPATGEALTGQLYIATHSTLGIPTRRRWHIRWAGQPAGGRPTP